MMNMEVIIKDGNSFLTASKGVERKVIVKGASYETFKKWTSGYTETRYDFFMRDILIALQTLLDGLDVIGRLNAESYSEALSGFGHFIFDSKTWEQIVEFTQERQ